MIYTFEGFQLDARKRLLLRYGEPVQLKSKVLDLLLVLVESGGREITKEELMERVWADQIVEDANLTVTMSLLRKALGEKATEHRFIVTIPGRGYRFVGKSQVSEGLIVEQHTVSQIVINEFDDRDKSVAPVIETKSRGADGYAAQPANPATAVKPRRALSEATAKSSHRFLFAGLVLAALTTAGLAGALYLRGKRNPILPFAGGPIKQLTTKGNVGWSAISPDGKFYVYTLFERGEYKSSLWLGQVDANSDLQLRQSTESGAPRRLEGFPEEKTYPYNWSPDGKLFAFVRAREISDAVLIRDLK